ncbi:hypothetical protein [Arthrobacter sp. GMC3]|uniref:hypothetical protein n=1 Tax=Arthrobacter sp. GMC3 TaxID=2058894 RepID=UPI000CE2CBE3|nr:hypothetical protein [Arthrobacter sp. GMC3]
MAKKKPWNWVGTLGCTVLIALFVAGGIMGVSKSMTDADRTAALESADTTLHEVSGTVAKVGTGGKSSSRIIHVAFTTRDGVPVSTRVYTAGSNRNYAKNQRVGVVYAAQMPEAARLAVDPGRPYTLSGRIVSAVIGWAIALVLVWLAIRDIWPRAKKHRSRKPRAPRRGRKVHSRR